MHDTNKIQINNNNNTTAAAAATQQQHHTSSYQRHIDNNFEIEIGQRKRKRVVPYTPRIASQESTMSSPSSSFGSWYDEHKAAENGDGSASSSSWFSIDSEQVLPLFNSENLQGFSFESMKQSMEAQMPKKIMGMGYQQRFKVCDLSSLLSFVFFYFFFSFICLNLLLIRYHSSSFSG